MADEKRPPAPEAPDVEQHPEQHEQSDISIRSLVIFFVIFIVFTVVSLIGLFALYAAFDRAEQRTMEDVSAIEEPRLASPIPLQGIPGSHDNTPAMDMRAYQKQQEEHLNSGGPTTQPGYVRIPIDQAMDLVIQRRMLPVRAPATQPATSASGNGAGVAR